MTANNNKILLAILWPLAGLLSALKNWRQPWAMNVFWIVCVFFSLIHIYNPSGEQLGQGADIGRYVMSLQYMNRTDISLQDAILINGKPDFYQPVLTYIVSQFTGEGHILFMIFGIIYGFFYSRNVWYVLYKIPKDIPKYSWVLISLLFLICPIWNVSGVRMWTALHIFVYGAMPYLIEKKNKKLVWCILTPFVHYSFFFPLLVLAAYWAVPVFFKQRKWVLSIFFVLYILTFFVNVMDLSHIGNILERIAPNLFENNMAGYLGEEYVQKVADAASDKSVLFKFVRFISTWSMPLLLYSVIHTINNVKDDKANAIRRLLLFGLILYSLGNIISIAPSGGRYIILAQMFVFPAIVLVLTLFNTGRYQMNIRFILICLIPSIFFNIRIGLECYGYNLVIGNFLFANLFENNISFITYLQRLI